VKFVSTILCVARHFVGFIFSFIINFVLAMYVDSQSHILQSGQAKVTNWDVIIIIIINKP